MYAVIRTGGKQERVSEGQRLAVELLDAPVGGQVELEAVLVVDGAQVLATPEELAGATVSAKVLGEELGPKIRAGTYKSKSNQRRRWGHRQRFSTIEIVAISGVAAKKPAPRSRAKAAATPAD
jgi:large subunit ribosomal protein L21